MPGVVVLATGQEAQRTVRKLRGAGCMTTLMDTSKVAAKTLKDADIRGASVMVIDAKYASEALLGRIAALGTPTVVLGRQHVPWSACLRPVVSALRQTRQ